MKPGTLTGLIAAFTCTVLIIRCAGVLLDFRDAIYYPFEIDYGEGIVWQQAELFLAGQAYARPSGFPFLIFHYPPLYYTVVLTASSLFNDLLQAGRAVSVVASLGLALAVMLTVWKFHSTTSLRLRTLLAMACGLAALGSGNVWTWGLLMRVDLLAIFFSFAGLLLAHHSKGRFGGVLAALLLCTAAVFTKQTQVSAGLAVLFVAFLQKSFTAVAAGVVVSVAAALGLAALQFATRGGFLANVVTANLNVFSVEYLLMVLRIESRDSLLLLVGSLSAIWLVYSVRPLRSLPSRVRSDPFVASCVLAVSHYCLCGLTLFAVAKQGSNANYFIEFLVSGVVVVGLTSVSILKSRQPQVVNFQLLALAASAVIMPWRGMPALATFQNEAATWSLVEQIKHAKAPVSSENMSLLMRASSGLVYEPAITKQLTLTGQWNEAPLLDWINTQRFAFMITIDSGFSSISLRTPAVDAAMRAVYPLVLEDAPGLWVHRPADRP